MGCVRCIKCILFTFRVPAIVLEILDHEGANDGADHGGAEVLCGGDGFHAGPCGFSHEALGDFVQDQLADALGDAEVGKIVCVGIHRVGHDLGVQHAVAAEGAEEPRVAGVQVEAILGRRRHVAHDGTLAWDQRAHPAGVEGGDAVPGRRVDHVLEADRHGWRPAAQLGVDHEDRVAPDGGV
eukprot:scaffold1620_cov233-Pinguiococcus_pyrenoidosus.AAC.1